ncbi:coiled-coil domain-containing protein [Nocardiopsis alkaliphila]|uniref:ATP synthase F0 subunit B n=1 Tax=Nocardiopsis alkaliphila TaxID=225762 RepID=UPI0003784F7C|nr:ATP synthase F0 subunit B [Nocardiopsis alkaliphila]
MLPGGGLQQDRFPTVRKGGYDKAHVDDYYVRMDNQFKDLRERLQRMDDELEQYKRDLAIAREKAQVKPEHEQISERMAEIIRIAEEEAKERRSKVDAEVKEAQKKAEAEITKHRKDAEEHAERIVSTARTEANEMVAGAKKEAEQLREQAQREGERKLNEAEARAQKIHDTADRRLATLTATHAEALRRLKDMHSTLADLVTAEDRAGALESGLSREETTTARAENPKGEDKASQTRPQQGKASQGQAPEGKAAATANAERNKSAGPRTPGADEQGQEQATTRIPPLQQESDEATVRIKPVPKAEQAEQGESAEQGKGEDAGPKAGTPQPPQGARFSGPAPGTSQQAPSGPQQAPSGPQQAPTDTGDPGVTGIYRRPEGPQQPSTGDEGVRVIRKP